MKMRWGTKACWDDAAPGRAAATCRTVLCITSTGGHMVVYMGAPGGFKMMATHNYPKAVVVTHILG